MKKKYKVSPDLVKSTKNLTWLSYVEDCGKSIYTNNGMRAHKNFDEIYKDKEVNWSGVYLKTMEEFQWNNALIHLVYIKMNPTDSVPESGDLILMLSDPIFQANSDLFNDLKEGSNIKFKGVFNKIASEEFGHLFDFTSMEKDGDKITDISSIPNIEIDSNKNKNLRGSSDGRN